MADSVYRPLILFWRAVLRKHCWTMDLATQEMVAETIRVLSTMERDRRLTPLQRELRQIQEIKRR